MRISLDFDLTYTVDPKSWNKFIDIFQAAGHEICIVTFRPPDCVDPAMEWLFQTKGVVTYFTNATPKKRFMDELGRPIDVWIDDSPDIIVNESSWTDGQRAQWKKDNGYDEKSLFDRLIEEPQHTFDFEDLEDITGGGSIR